MVQLHIWQCEINMWNVSGKFNTITTQSCFSSTGNNIAEIGASYIHGPCEENPVFCLARDYGLLDLEALTAENQAMDIDERPPWIPNWFSSSGRNATCHQPVLTLFFSISSYVH